MNTYKVIGIMSGSSLDGVDIAYCILKHKGLNWTYEIPAAVTIPYPNKWKEKISGISSGSALEFVKTHVEYGHFLGKLARKFITENNLDIDFISSHGHTVFHQPQNKMTFQIGDGSAIAANAGCMVINDFRSLDIALGGQGAPLVPIGDKLLFSEYHYCLNIGGFANISYDKNRTRIAFDICPANIIINKLAEILGREYDNKGKFAEKGKIDQKMLAELNGIPYYKKKAPKSLGREWVELFITPVVNKYKISVYDKLRTVYEHIATQIQLATNDTENKKILITGGGAYNDFLISRIINKINHRVIIPDDNTIKYKEALIFALLGALRHEGKRNCLKSVTGAEKDNTGGAIYLG